MYEWILSEINYGYVKDNPYQVAVLPMGATETHNLHLSYGTDTLESEAQLACGPARPPSIAGPAWSCY